VSTSSAFHVDLLTVETRLVVGNARRGGPEPGLLEAGHDVLPSRAGHDLPSPRATVLDSREGLDHGTIAVRLQSISANAAEGIGVGHAVSIAVAERHRGDDCAR
jgi:hypothetical protein